MFNFSQMKTSEVMEKRKKKPKSVVSFLGEKAEIERQSRDEDLKLRREQLSLERECFELEKIERIQKLEYKKQTPK